MTTDQTILYYNEHAKEFCTNTKDADMGACRDGFLNHLPDGASILDSGCGSGRDAKAFEEKGYQVTAIDAAPEICKQAEQLLNHRVECISFQELNQQEEYDGIWACASLLHVSEEEMHDVIGRLWKALKRDGVLYASFKYGKTERIAHGRFFHDYDEQSLKKLMDENHFTVIDLYVTRDVREDRADERWVNVLVRKEDK